MLTSHPIKYPKLYRRRSLKTEIRNKYISYTCYYNPCRNVSRQKLSHNWHTSTTTILTSYICLKYTLYNNIKLVENCWMSRNELKVLLSHIFYNAMETTDHKHVTNNNTLFFSKCYLIQCRFRVFVRLKSERADQLLL